MSCASAFSASLRSLRFPWVHERHSINDDRRIQHLLSAAEFVQGKHREREEAENAETAQST